MDFRRYAAALAAFAAVLYAALLIAALGVLSVVLGRDVIEDPAAGLFAGPTACAVACGVVFFGLLVRALRHRAPRRDIALGTAVLLAVGCYLGYGVGGGVVVGIVDPYRFLPFVVQQLIGPFAAAAGVLGLVVVLLDMIVVAARADERGRPRWPWEKHDP